MTKTSGSDSSNFQGVVQDALVEFKHKEQVRHGIMKNKDVEKQKNKQIISLFFYMIIAICTLVTISQMSNIRSSYTDSQKPLRKGAFDTDESTDQCINTLWQVVKQLQLGDSQLDGFTCPESGKPYNIIPDNIIPGNKNFTVQCPNPEIHGFSSIQVRTDTVIPVIAK